MALLYNLARVTTSTVGTGAVVTLGPPVSGFLSFAAAGAQVGDVVAYGIRDGAQSEVGTGVIGAGVGSLTRTTSRSTNANLPIALSGTAQIYITARAEEFASAGAPVDSPFLTYSASATLTNELVLTAGTNITLDTVSTPGQMIVSASSGGPGGSPAAPVNSVQFNNAGAFGGDSHFVWNNSFKGLGIGVNATGPVGQFEINHDGIPSNNWGAAFALGDGVSPAVNGFKGLTITGTQDNSANLTIQTIGSDDQTLAEWLWYRVKGVPGAPTALGQHTYIGQWQFAGKRLSSGPADDANARFHIGAHFFVTCNADWTASSAPAQFNFATVPVGLITLKRSLTIKNGGISVGFNNKALGIPPDTVQATLGIVNAEIGFQVNDGAGTSGQVLLSDGTKFVPGTVSGSLGPIAANTVLGNATNAAAVPVAVSAQTARGNALLNIEAITIGPDANYNISANDRVVRITGPLSAAWTYTLPAATTVNNGTILWLRGSNMFAASPLTMAVASGGTLRQTGIAGALSTYLIPQSAGPWVIGFMALDAALGNIWQIIPTPSAAQREVLTFARDYYVGGAGASDSNSGLFGFPFATIPRAVDVACSLDNSIYDVSIHVAAGTYTQPIVLRRPLGSGSYHIIGSGVSTCIISCTSPSTGAAISGDHIGKWTIAGFRLQCVTAGSLVDVSGAATQLQLDNMDYGPAGPGYIQIKGDGAVIWTSSNCIITGGGRNHVLMLNGAKYIIQAGGITHTCIGTFSYSDRFVNCAAMSLANFNGLTYPVQAGSTVTGGRYFVSDHAVIITGGSPATFFPGSIAPVAGDGTNASVAPYGLIR